MDKAGITMNFEVWVLLSISLQCIILGLLVALVWIVQGWFLPEFKRGGKK
jgi:hypothetical protein